MSALRRASFGYLRRHPWQLAPALIGICIGVAVIVAVNLATESSRRAFLLSMDAVKGAATHQIVSGAEGVDETLYVKLRRDEGIRRIAPVVEGYVDAGDRTLQLLGVDPFAERQFRSFTDPDAAGIDRDAIRRLLTEPGSVLLTDQTARALDLSPGDTFDLVANGRTLHAHLAGLMEDPLGNGSDSRLDNLLITDISTAQEWLDRRGRLSRIDVRLPDDGALREDIEDALPPGVLLLNAAGHIQSISGMSGAFTTNLAAMSWLALLVGLFLIYNSVSFAVLQRRSLFGVLRALGVTRREIVALLLGEALLLGIVGTSAGVGAGIWLGDQLLRLVSRSINDLYFVVHVTGVTITPAAVATGFLAGLGTTLVAAAVPAMEAASNPPRLALMRSALERRSGRLLWPVTAVGIVAAALAFVVLTVSGHNLHAGLGALFVLILGFALCIPVLVRVSSRLVAPLAAKVGGVTARLAIAGVSASLSRTAVAIVALAVAVSSTVGVGVMIGSFRDSVGDWLGDTLRADLYVGVAQGTLDPALVGDLLAVPEIASWSTSRRVWLESDAGRVQLTVLDRSHDSHRGARLRGGDPEVVWQAFENDGAVLVSDSYAYRHEVGPGDTVTLPTRNGERTFSIAAVYRSYSADLDTLLISRNTYDVFWDDRKIDSLGLYLDPDADEGGTMQRLHDIATGTGTGKRALIIRSNREIREQSMRIFDRTFLITGVLYWLAVIVALVGILGAMFALQLERARELAVLRALGMTPRQLGVMVTLQTGFIGFLCGLAAIPLGLVMAAVLIRVIDRRAFGWQMAVDLSPGVLVSAMAIAVGAALLAGIYPARHAARASPARAMREE